MRNLATGIAILALVLAAPAFAAGLSVTIDSLDTTAYPKLTAHLTVSDAAGKYVVGLQPADFTVTENGKPLTVSKAAPLVKGQSGIALALVIDGSGSMKGKPIEDTKAAAVKVIEALEPNDRAAVVVFGTRVDTLQELTADRAALTKAVTSISAKDDWTALYDGVYAGMKAIAESKLPRKVVLLLSDGDDNRSAMVLTDCIRYGEATGISVFVVGLGHQVNRDALQRLASLTGGQARYSSDPQELALMHRTIAERVEREYALEFTSSLPRVPEARKLAIAVTAAGATGTAQREYALTVVPPPSRTGVYVSLALFALGALAAWLLLGRGRGKAPAQARPRAARRPAAAGTAAQAAPPQPRAAAPTLILSRGPMHKAWLVVKEGPETGKELWLDPRGGGIGRGAHNALILADEAVSGEHAKFGFSDGEFYLHDLASRNGTFVNGERITRQVLHDGDVVQMGMTKYVFKLIQAQEE